MTLEVRADSGFAIPALYDYCEAEGIAYTIGLVPNPRLDAAVAPLLAEATRQSTAAAGAKVRLLGETTYQAGSWPTARRVVMKAEVLAKGPNTRFVVTTRTDPPEVLSGWYTDRGESENWINDLESGLLRRPPQLPPVLGQPVPVAAPRRRLLAARHAAAVAARRRVARMTLATLRLRLIKIGGWVRQRLDRVAPAPRHQPSQRALVARPRDPPQPS